MSQSWIRCALLLVPAIFMSFFSPDLRACDFCMLGQGVSPYMTATGRGVTLDVNSIVLDHVYDRSQSIDSQGKQESWLVYSVTAFYPLSDDWTLLATVPYAIKTNIDYDASTNTNPGELIGGVGDVTLTGRYTVLRHHSLDSTLIAGLLTGVKFPTGSTSDTDAQGNPVDRHALPGTGSFDFDVGFSGSYATAEGFQLTLDAVDRIPTTGKWDGRDHRYGNMFNYSTKAYYRVATLGSGAAFMPFIGASGETMGKEVGTQTDSGYNPDLVNLSTGGTVLYADFGLYSILSPTTFANAGFSKAFYHYENYDPGFDPDPAENYRLDFSVTFLF